MTTLITKKSRAKDTRSAPPLPRLPVKPGSVSLTDFRQVHEFTPISRVQWIRQGVRAIEVKNLVRMMDMSQDKLFKSLKLSTGTVNRKAKRDEALQLVQVVVHFHEF